MSLLFDLTDALSLVAVLLWFGTTSADTDTLLGFKLLSPLDEVRPSPMSEVAFIERRFWIRDEPDPGPAEMDIAQYYSSWQKDCCKESITNAACSQ